MSADPPVALRGGETVAIVGAGIAGLTAAWELKKRGVEATVFEGGGRVGGRIWTDCDSRGAPFERGAEFINADHKDIIALADELDVPLHCVYAADQRAPVIGYQTRGGLRSDREFAAALRPLVDRLRGGASPHPGETDAAQAVHERLDAMPASDYLAIVPLESWAREMVELFMVAEMGVELEAQPAANLWELAEVREDRPCVVPDGYAKYIVDGGTSALTDTLARRVEPQIRLHHRLEAVRESAGGGYRLTFAGQGRDVAADWLVLALPFSTLRRVELTNVPLGALKRRAIAELGMGTNGKVVVGYEARVADARPGLSEVFSPEAGGFVWESGRYERGAREASSLVVYRGGKAGARIRDSVGAAEAEAFVAALEAAYPGSRGAFTGEVIGVSWADNPLALGSYSSMRPGQQTEFGGALAAPERRILFAGEHAAPHSRCFMNGAVASGRAAAQNLLRAVGQGA